MFDKSDIDTILDAAIQQIKSYPEFMAAEAGGKCHVCETELIEKGDWVFCPKHSIDIPDCDTAYHIARNKATGAGWTTAMKR